MANRRMDGIVASTLLAGYHATTVLAPASVAMRLGRFLRCYPNRLPEKVRGNRRAVLGFGLLSFTMFIGAQQELYLFQSFWRLNCLSRRSITQYR